MRPVTGMALTREELHLVASRCLHVIQDALEKGCCNSPATTRMSDHECFDDRRGVTVGSDVREQHQRSRANSNSIQLSEVHLQPRYLKHVRPRFAFDFGGRRWGPSIRITAGMDVKDGRQICRQCGTYGECRLFGSTSQSWHPAPETPVGGQRGSRWSPAGQDNVGQRRREEAIGRHAGTLCSPDKPRFRERSPVRHGSRTHDGDIVGEHGPDGQVGSRE